MTTRITDRFSKITRIPTPITGEDKLIISQTNGSTKKVVSILVAENYVYVKDTILRDGITRLINFGTGFIGNGTSINPITIDPEWLDGTLIKNEHLYLTRVGNRKTRYLPISRESLYTTSVYQRTLCQFPVTATVESSGELKLIRQADLGVSNTAKAHTISVGDWVARDNLESQQIIERPIQPPSLEAYFPPKAYLMHVTGNTHSSAIITVNDGTATRTWWMADLIDGNLNEDSFHNLSYLGVAPLSDTANNSYAAFSTSTGRYLLSVIGDGGSANAGITVRCEKVNGVGRSATRTRIANWNVSSYAGFNTAQGDIVVSNTVTGSATDKCELITTGVTGLTLEQYSSTLKLATKIQVVQNRKNINDVYLIIRREHLLVYGGVKTPYVRDIVLKLTINASGVGTATAIDKYLRDRPILSISNNLPVITNQRKTFIGANRATIEPEVMSLLPDGSFMLVGEKISSESVSSIKLYRSPDAVTNMDMLDIDAAVTANKHGPELILDPKPKYTDNVNGAKKVYIASDIKGYINGGAFTIPAGVRDLSSVATEIKPIGKIPYAGDKYENIQAYAAHFYIQQAYQGQPATIVTSRNKIPESEVNTWFASVYFPVDGSPAIITGQAYSRMGKYRLAYEPQGSAVGVSYGSPAGLPGNYWVQGGASSGNKRDLTHWIDSDARNRMVTGVMADQTVYAKAEIGDAVPNRRYRLLFNEVSMGDLVYGGQSLVWKIPSVGNVSTASRPMRFEHGEFKMRDSSGDVSDFYEPLSLQIKPAFPAETYTYKLTWFNEILGYDETIELRDVKGSQTIRAPNEPDSYSNFRFTNSKPVSMLVMTGVLRVTDWGTDEKTNIQFSGRSLTKVPDYIPTYLTDCWEMFSHTTRFNDSNVTKWNTSHVTHMARMFAMAPSFNQPIGNWDVSNVKFMWAMFHGATSFNQPLNNWNVGSVVEMSSMFSGSNFNQPLNNWNVSNVTNMANMFYGTTVFNQPLNNWNTAKVTDMSYMFHSSGFRGDLSQWCVPNFRPEYAPPYFAPNLQIAYHPKWGTCPVNSTRVTKSAQPTPTTDDQITSTPNYTEIKTSKVIDTTNNQVVLTKPLTIYTNPVDVTVSSDGIPTSSIRLGGTYDIDIVGIYWSIGDEVKVNIFNGSGGRIFTNTYIIDQRIIESNRISFSYKPTAVSKDVLNVQTKTIRTVNNGQNITDARDLYYQMNVETNKVEYGPGTYTITLEPGKSLSMILVGGGGGGGGSIHRYSSSVYNVSGDGEKGKDSLFYYLDPYGGVAPLANALIAGGGSGGKGGSWGNGSSYSNGEGGAGGIPSTTNALGMYTSQATNGYKPPTVSRWERQLGGVNLRWDFPLGYRGNGGTGAIGAGDERWSYGGGGGSSATVFAIVENNSTTARSFRLTVGTGGLGWKKTAVTNGNNGDNGDNGYAIITYN